MFSKIVVKPTTQPNVASLIANVLAGETNPANLGSFVDAAQSTIISNTPAGWTIHDAAAGTNTIVIKAPLADDATKFKYAKIAVPTPTGVAITGAEDWNATTHTPTNLTANASSSSEYQIIDLTNGFTMYIAANARGFVLMTTTATTSGNYGNGVYIVAERSRTHPWDTVAAGFCPLVVIDTYECLYGGAKKVFMPRVKNKTGMILTGTSAVAGLITIGVNSDNFDASTIFPSGADAKVVNAAGVPVIPTFPIYIQDAAVFCAPLGDITSTTGFMLLPRNVVGSFETIVYGATELFSLKCSNDGNVLVVPKA